MIVCVPSSKILCFSNYSFTPNYPTIGLKHALYLACKNLTNHYLVKVKNKQAKILGIVLKFNRRCKGECLGCVMATT